MSARFIVADVFDGIASLADDSVDLVMTSPPFLALRSYLPADHLDKAREIGSEPTPGAFIDALLDVVEALDRVLAPHGSLVFELGDTYSGSGGGGGDYLEGGFREGQPGFGGSAERQRRGNAEHWRMKNRERSAWPLDKSLTLVPESFRWALAYGRNPFTGRLTPPWRVRNVVRWHRPNPPVGALGDKFRPATSDLVVACKSRTRYFDLDAVRTESTAETVRRGQRPRLTPYAGNDRPKAPPLDTWVIPTAPYKGSHYATFPPDLCVLPVKSMCPERVCRVCGEPSRRIVEHTNSTGVGHRTIGDPQRNARNGSSTDAPDFSERLTLGWTHCGHDDWRTGVVLDPFAGSGTTLAVATGHGRDAIGIDLDARNADLARERVGMWLDVEHLATEVPA